MVPLCDEKRECVLGCKEKRGFGLLSANVEGRKRPSSIKKSNLLPLILASLRRSKLFFIALIFAHGADGAVRKTKVLHRINNESFFKMSQLFPETCDFIID